MAISGVYITVYFVRFLMASVVHYINRRKSVKGGVVREDPSQWCLPVFQHLAVSRGQ